MLSRISIRSIFITALFFLAPQASQAGYDQAKAAFAKKNFEDAREACAQSNDPKCHNLLAALYVNGLGVEKDYGQAQKYWEKSIQGGFYKAYGNYSRQLLLGRGMAQNFDKGVELAETAYELGLKEGDKNFVEHLAKWMVKFHRGVRGGDTSLVGKWQKRLQDLK